MVNVTEPHKLYDGNEKKIVGIMEVFPPNRGVVLLLSFIVRCIQKLLYPKVVACSSTFGVRGYLLPGAEW
jgi:hypothetical protein